MDRYIYSVVGGAALPVASTLVSIVTLLEPRAWFSPATEWRGMAAVGILFSTVLLLVAAPLAGVAVAVQDRISAPRTGAWKTALSTCWTLLLGASAWAGAAAALTGLVAWVAGEGPSTPVLAPHAVQAAAALALALIGAAAAASFREPLDASAFSLGLAALTSVGLLAGGTLLELVPAGFVNWAVAANPLLAISSTAHIDLMRTDVVYQISPLAHVQTFAFAWPAATAFYGAVAATCAGGLGLAYARAGTEWSFNQQRKDIA